MTRILMRKLCATTLLCLGGMSVATANDNVYYGESAGYDSESGEGTGNAGFGKSALMRNRNGSQNSGFGGTALMSNTDGSGNAAFGFQALFLNQADSNSAFGAAALQDNTIGKNNVAIGAGDLYRNEGSNNIGLGTDAGQTQSTGSNNIYIGSDGAEVENGQIKIGTKGKHSNVTIAGVSGNTVSGGTTVLVNSKGELGTVMSSRRYKEAVTEMSMGSNALQSLRPVSFKYRAEAGGDGKTLEYGLIAEEVASVAPELAVYDDAGKPTAVRYHLLAPMLLNEVQIQRREINKQATTIKRSTQSSL